MPSGISTPKAGAVAKLTAAASFPSAIVFNLIKAVSLAHPAGMFGFVGGSLALLGIYDAVRKASTGKAAAGSQGQAEAQSAEQRPAAGPVPLKNA